MSPKSPKNQKNLDKEVENLGAYQSEETQNQISKGEQTMSDQTFDSNDSFTFQPDFSDTYEEHALPAGTEVRFQIRSADIGTSQKSGGKYFRLGISIPEDPEAKDFNEFLNLPGPNDDRKTANRKNMRLRAFMQCVGLDETRPFVPQDLIGLEGYAILGCKEDPEYGEQNSIKKYVTGA